jgi:hypothetical protein
MTSNQTQQIVETVAAAILQDSLHIRTGATVGLTMNCKLPFPTQAGVVHGHPEFSVIQENLVVVIIKHNHQNRHFLWFTLLCCPYLRQQH